MDEEPEKTKTTEETSPKENLPPVKPEAISTSRGSAALYIGVAVVCLLGALSAVVFVLVRRRQRRRRGYSDFASLEMRDYSQWQQDAGL